MVHVTSLSGAIIDDNQSNIQNCIQREVAWQMPYLAHHLQLRPAASCKEVLWIAESAKLGTLKICRIHSFDMCSLGMPQHYLSTLMV